MELEKRKLLLESYLELFGKKKIIWTKIENDKIYGTLIFSDNGEQDFCWQMTETDIPYNELIELIKILRDNKLIDIDKINTSFDELFIISKWRDKEDFEKVFNCLFDFEVKMIDEGEETDSYFLHL